MGSEEEILVSSNLMNLVDDLLEHCKRDPSSPQFKDRDAMIDYALQRFLLKHASAQFLDKWRKKGLFDQQN